jgi:acyl-CoA thioesterase
MLRSESGHRFTPRVPLTKDRSPHATHSASFYLLSTVHKALALGADIGVRASLDHAIWFYDHFDISEWVLLVMQAQGAWNARGIAMARCYSQDGRLVAVVVSLEEQLMSS